MRFPDDYEFIPLKNSPEGNARKEPAFDGWRTDPPLSRDQAEELSGLGRNYGVRLRSCDLVVDIDPRNGGDESMLGFDTSKFPTVLTPSGGKHLYMTKPPDFKIHHTVKKYFPGIEFKTVGRQVVGPGSIHPNGKRYEFEDIFAPPFGPEGAPAMPEVLAVRIQMEAVIPTGGGDWTDEQLETVLSHLDPVNYADHDIWLSIMMASHEATGGTGEDVFTAWSLRDPQYSSQEKVIRSRWQSLQSGKPGGVGIGTLRHILVQAGVQDIGFDTAAEDFAEFANDLPENRPVPPPPNLLFFQYNDYGNEQRFTALFSGRARYCHQLKKWLVWDGRRWALDSVGKVMQLGKKTMIAFLRQAVDAKNSDAEKFAKASLRHGSVVSMLAMAQSSLPIEPSQLDQNPNELNFLNGTLDLRTGKLRPHDPKDWNTKIVHQDYNPAATAPVFMAFMERILSISMIDFLQKAFGYSLTGLTSAKVVFVCLGGGDNGKTTLLNAFRFLIREYATAIQINTLMTKQEDNNSSADLADLFGTRFATTSETEDGHRIAEGRIKRITQGDDSPIKTARKFENPIQFPETHKLWMDANHRPLVRGTDNAIWNRLCLIRFDVTIPKAEQDTELKFKLRNEAEGILAWAVVGAARWYQEGLGKPPDIEKAVMDWRQESDPLGDFFSDVCDFTNPESVCTVRDMWSGYLAWCNATGTSPLFVPKFNARIELKGGVRTSRWIEGVKTKVWERVSVQVFPADGTTWNQEF